MLAGLIQHCPDVVASTSVHSHHLIHGCLEQRASFWLYEVIHSQLLFVSFFLPRLCYSRYQMISSKSSVPWSLNFCHFWCWSRAWHPIRMVRRGLKLMQICGISRIVEHCSVFYCSKLTNWLSQVIVMCMLVSTLALHGTGYARFDLNCVLPISLFNLVFRFNNKY